MKGYKPQPREYYISKCRYYDGTEESSLSHFCAGYEQFWVDLHFKEGGIYELKGNIKEYKAFGLGHFNHDDGIPISLKALIWTRYMHWGSGCETPETFGKWWRQFYLDEQPTD